MKKGTLYFFLTAIVTIVGYAITSRSLENSRDFH
ncbi:hypothetical protein JOC33_003236 [Thalassobacillus pellis]|nr:hypothetical protein [Thalassobacillus pellis]